MHHNSCTMTNRLLFPLVSSIVNGTTFGALVFAGVVDVRALFALADAEGAEAMFKLLFPVWWPYGRDLMGPLTLFGCLLNLTAFHRTKDRLWAVSAATHALILGWTAVVMRRDIEVLVQAKMTSLAPTVRSFGRSHMPRILFAGIGYVASTLALLFAADPALSLDSIHM